MKSYDMERVVQGAGYDFSTATAEGGFVACVYGTAGAVTEEYFGDTHAEAMSLAYREFVRNRKVAA